MSKNTDLERHFVRFLLGGSTIRLYKIEDGKLFLSKRVRLTLLFCFQGNKVLLNVYSVMLPTSYMADTTRCTRTVALLRCPRAHRSMPRPSNNKCRFIRDANGCRVVSELVLTPAEQRDLLQGGNVDAQAGPDAQAGHEFFGLYFDGDEARDGKNGDSHYNTH